MWGMLISAYRASRMAVETTWQRRVLVSRHQDKVVWSVVCFIAVKMMDMFVRVKLATNALFDNQPMLALPNLRLSHFNLNVSISNDACPHGAPTTMGFAPRTLARIWPRCLGSKFRTECVICAVSDTLVYRSQRFLSHVWPLSSPTTLSDKLSNGSFDFKSYFWRRERRPLPSPTTVSNQLSDSGFLFGNRFGRSGAHAQQFTMLSYFSEA